jgi:type IV pilus assembly protein PilF
VKQSQNVRRPGASGAQDAPARVVAGWVIALGVAAFGVAGCVSTENSRSAGSGAPPGSAAQLPGSRNDTDTGARTRGAEASDETRRRARIRLELAASHYQSGNNPQALTEVEQAISIDRRFPAAYGMRALIHWQIGDVERAEADFRQALAIEPADAETNNNFGWFLCKTNRPKDSIPYFQAASADRLYRTPAMPLHNAGICSMQAGDEAAAENYFLRAFQIDPGNAVAMYNLGELYLKRGNVERARFYTDRLLSQYQPNAETLWLGIRVARRGGDATYANTLGQQLDRQFPASRENTLLKRGAFQ